MEDAEPYEIVRLMGLSHREFMRSLPAAVVGMEYRVQGLRVLLVDRERRVQIDLGPEQQRRLGALLLPQTRVRLSFYGFSVQKRDQFCKRFDRAFQRGGG